MTRVLIWCHGCTRYISDEHRHHCSQTPITQALRRQSRRNKREALR